VRFAYLFMHPDGAALAEIAEWVDAGKLRAVIHETFGLTDFARAFAALESGRARGKVVIRI
jgi:alcohol dehydrogenase